MVLPECEETCYSELAPLIIGGIAYSNFAGIICAFIPEVVDKSLLGTAYGIGMSMLNIALSTTPTIGAVIHDKTIDFMYGFFWVSFILILIS